MEILKLIKSGDIKEIFKTDKIKFAAIQNAMNELLLYDAKYGITIDNINTNDIIIEFCITVPEHSELKSDREFEMCGIYLANQFKTNVIEMIKKIYNIIKPESKLPIIKVKYASIIGSKLTEIASSDEQTKLVQEMADNIYYPFSE